MSDKPKKQYRLKDKHHPVTSELCNRIRERLKLTKKQLSDSTIKKVIKLNGKLLGEWVVNNADGFQIKDNGIIIVSKFLPKCLRGDKQETIEAILANPKNDQYMKDMFIKRYNKSLLLNRKKSTPDLKMYYSNAHSFFHVYRIIWFNSRNCAFDKAELYELKVTSDIKDKLNKKIVEGKDYFAWNFSDFRLRKRDKLKKGQG